jgi:hypothetical protein
MGIPLEWWENNENTSGITGKIMRIPLESLGK